MDMRKREDGFLVSFFSFVFLFLLLLLLRLSWQSFEFFFQCSKLLHDLYS